MHDDDEVEVTAENKLGKQTIRGPLALLLTIVGMGAIGLGLYKHEVDTRDRQASTVTEVRSIKMDVEKKFDEVVYVLTLSPAEREALKLDMPDSLRKRRNQR